MTIFELKNKICEIRSLISSDWVGIEERRSLYVQLHSLEKTLKELNEKENSQD